MAAVNVVGRFIQQNDLQAYRRKLAHELRRQDIFRLLPALIDLPIEVQAPGGNPSSLGAALGRSRHLSLHGLSGSGRRLALLQAALRWAEGAGAAPPPVLLDLPQLDDGTSTPAHLLAAYTLAALRPAEPGHLREPLAFLRRIAGDDELPAHAHLLMIYGWEELPPDRRTTWQSALQALARDQIGGQMLIVLPLSEPAWPGFDLLSIVPTSPALCASWVEHLAPAEFRARSATALAQGGSLHMLSERIFDIAMLAWLMPSAGLPRSRGELYAQALATMLRVPMEQLDRSQLLTELQLLAAYDDPASQIISPISARDALGRVRFIHPQVRRYLAARQLVAEQRYELLGALDAAECAEIAPLIAALLDDPTPLYAALWGLARRHPSLVRTLARCLREQAPPQPAWTLRIIGALAAQLQHGDTATQESTRQLLEACMPALDACLPLAARAAEQVQRFVLQLFGLIPPELALPRAQSLALSSETPEPFAWSLADRVIEQTSAEQELIAPPRSNAQSMARWLYIQARRNPAECRQTEPAALVVALQTLGASSAGEARKLFTAAALIEDRAQASAVRLAALALLVGSSQPPAHTVAERACGDADPLVRRRALEVLSQLDPARAAVALGRAAMDRSASWDLRLAAIQHLGETKPQGAERLLLHCANDPGLPLYARLKASAVLAISPAGVSELCGIVSSAQQPALVRAVAAYALGAGGADSLPKLLGLLEDRGTPAIVIEGACRGLGALGDRAAAAALARLIERSAADTALTLAALGALGRIGDRNSVEAISPLLGRAALARLERSAEASLHQQPAQACLGDPALPQPIAERLALALADSPNDEARPTTLAEFLSGEADRIRIAAAQALSAIGGNAARAALLAALLDQTTGGATADIIAALADLEGDENAESLGHLLNAAELNPLTHWLAARQLGAHPAGEPLMLRGLRNSALDTFTRGALAEGLGQRHALSALTPLRQLAEDSQVDAHIRSQALLGLGLLDDPTTETILTRLIGDASEELALRGLAAEQLPTRLSAEGRRFLREILRAERTPEPLAIGALRTLGRVRDREALPLMLRYCQGETSDIALAAIDALTDLGDSSVAPVLVRISQHHGAEHALRLQAVSALLRIGGDGYLPLLRAYLHQGPLPFRMLALEALLASQPSAAELLPMLSSSDWPAAMRLRLLDFYAGDTGAAPALIELLEASADDQQLRILAAEALGRLHWGAAAPALIGQALHPAAALGLRARCITALYRLDDTASWAALSQLAEDHAQPDLLCSRAQRVLLDAVAGPPNAGTSSTIDSDERRIE